MTLAATQEDVPTLFTSLELLAAATDEDGDTPTIVAVAAASANGGSVSYNADAGTGVYTPKADWNGDDTFTFTVGDGNGGLTAGTAHIKVEAARDPPVVRDVNLNDTTEDAPLAFTEADLLSGASDVDVGDTLSVASVAAASVKGGVVTYDVASKTGLFTPARDFNGDDAFTFAVTDGAGTPVSAAARVHVTPAPDAPEAADVVFAAREDTPLTLSEARLLEAARDADAGDVLSIASVATASLHGAVVMRDLGAKTILYTPPANFHGEDEFEFTVADAAGATAAAKFKLNVGAFFLRFARLTLFFRPNASAPRSLLNLKTPISLASPTHRAGQRRPRRRQPGGLQDGRGRATAHRGQRPAQRRL